MKISIRDVQVGRFFVKTYQVREIVKDLGYDVQYREYDFDTGEPQPFLPGQCSKEHITRWAVRECAPEEVARMKRDWADAVQEEIGNEYVRNLLNAIPYEVLINEMRRRGLSLDE
ncbi:MAG: hypothetical protein JNM02_04220 [Anaerolineales bacterium]|nr:hypothetical protein [Anaerolineales bacterium]